MFTIMEEDYRSYPQDSGKWSDPQNSEAKAQAVADKLDAYLAEKTAAGFDKPVFIACHVPIHYNTRTKNKADAIYGDVIYKTLYKYGDDLNIIFLEDSRLFEAVMELPDKYRTVIHLFYYEEYSVREIADILRCREGTVKSQLSRGRALLKTKLKEDWNDDE